MGAALAGEAARGRALDPELRSGAFKLFSRIFSATLNVDFTRGTFTEKFFSESPTTHRFEGNFGWHLG